MESPGSLPWEMVVSGLRSWYLTLRLHEVDLSIIMAKRMSTEIYARYEERVGVDCSESMVVSSTTQMRY